MKALSIDTTELKTDNTCEKSLANAKVAFKRSKYNDVRYGHMQHHVKKAISQ